MRGCSGKKMERAVKILRKGGGGEEEEEEERRSLSLSSSTSRRAIGGEDDGYPQPMEGLKEVGPPPFLKKTYEMVEDASTDDIVSWSQSHNSFVVWDSHKFSTTLLPKYFKHNNFSSFIRQLNTYGFRKVDSDRWEFANEGFLAGQKHLLKTIKRRRRRRMSMQEHQQVVGVGGCCVEVGKFGLETEIDMLRRDRNVLMTEILKLRQQQHKSRKQLVLMEERLLNTETKQQQMMTFLAKALNNPSFIHQFLQLQQRTTSSNGLPAAGVEVGRKRRLTTTTTTTASPSSENLLQPSQREAVSVPTEEEDDLASMESDFETFFSAAAAAMDDESSTDVQHNPVSTSSGSLGPLSETMWEDLLNEDLMTGDGNPGGEEKDDDVLVTKPSPEWGEDNLHLHLHDLVDQMGFLGSKS